MVALRYAILSLLCAQNSLYTLLRRYSRGVLKETVSSAAVLLASEALKFGIAVFLLEAQTGSGSSGLCGKLRAARHALAHSRPMAVPAIVYLIMNLLSFKAIELVDATTFAMIAQLKVLSTAVCTLIVLGRRLSVPQWRAIFLLTLSVIIITYQRGSAAVSAARCADAGSGKAGEAESAATKEFHASFMLGVGMVLLEISLSGWISAYFEKYLKDGAFTVWGRNLQLAFWSLLVYSSIEVVNAMRGGDDYVRDLTQGWSMVTLALVLLGGGGGLLVAFAIKHADAVMKSMATSFALVVVVIAEMLFLGAPPDPVVCLSSGIALLALQTYTEAPKYESSGAKGSTAAQQVTDAKKKPYVSVPLGSPTPCEDEESLRPSNTWPS